MPATATPRTPTEYDLQERAKFQDNPEFASTLDRFKAKLAEFNRVYQALLAKKNVANLTPELRADYDALMNRADTIKGMINKAQEAIDWVRLQVDQASSVFDGMGNLGFLPIIAWGVGIAAMGGAITAMAYWISGAYEWSKRAEIAQRVADAGGTPGEINQAVAESGGIFGKMGSLLLLAGIGFLIWRVNQ